MAKKKQSEIQNIDILHDYLELDIHKPSNRVQIFFNLLYLQPPIDVVLAQNPLHILKELALTRDTFDINEACAIILACNTQNLDIFLKIPVFHSLCTDFCKKFPQFPSKYHHLYVQCLQASFLHYIDTKTTKVILKHIRILRENGLITFHDQKCIETALQADKTQTQKTAVSKEINAKPSVQVNSFLQLNPIKTPLKTQLDCIAKAKSILRSIKWTQQLSYLCDDNFVKNIIMVGPKNTGKSTFLKTIFHDPKHSTSCKAIEAHVPFLYHYGKSFATQVNYMQLSDLRSLQESPIAEISTMFKALEKDHHISFERGHEKLEYNDIYDNFYTNKKIHLADNVLVTCPYKIFKYVNFINTPALIPSTFRHLQLYEYLAKSDIALYFLSLEALSGAGSAYDGAIKSLTRLVERNNLSYVHVIATQVDKTNLTIKKRQAFCAKIKRSIEKTLSCSEELKQARLKRLHFHFVALNIAQAIRHGDSAFAFESGFDLISSGVPELERQIAEHIFENPFNHFNIKLLGNILELCKNNYLNPELSSDLELTKKLLAVAPSASEAAKQRIQNLKSLCQEILKKLPTQHYALYDSFANLRDNLYAQFMQSLNYEVQQHTNFNSDRLKKSLTESLVIGLHELSKILQEYFFSLKELQLISATLDPKNKDSLVCFAHTPYHKEILKLMFEHFKQSVSENFFNDSNMIVAEHLAYRLNLLLPSNIKSIDIQEETIITPIKENFDYYFLLLDRNIGSLINRKVEMFYRQLARMERILEAYFIDYYHDFGKCEFENIDKIITGIINGGIK